MAAKIQYFPKKTGWRVLVRWMAKDARYRIEWYENGERDFAYRKNRQKANALAKAKLAELDNGETTQQLSIIDRQLLDLARELGPVKLRAAVERERTISRKRITSEVIEEFLACPGQEWSKSSRSDYTNRLNYFAKTFGRTFLSEITVEAFAEWRSQFVDLSGTAQEIKANRRNANNYHAAVAKLLKWASHRNYLPQGEELITSRVERFRRVKTAIRIFTVEQVRQILSDLPENPKHRAYLILHLFLPFRPSDLTGVKGDRKGIRWEHIDLDNNVVNLTEEVVGKVSKPRQIEIPPNAREWLIEFYRKPSDQVCRTDSNSAVAAHVKKLLKCEWQADILRHTVISHLLARTGNDANWVARQAGNSVNEIRSSYEVILPEAKGKEYFDLSPSDESKISSIAAIS